MKNIYNTNAFSIDATKPEWLKFYTPGGWLNQYALACGYQERFNYGAHSVRLYLDGCYHVRDSVTGQWETFIHVMDARRFFVRRIKQIRGAEK